MLHIEQIAVLRSVPSIPAVCHQEEVVSISWKHLPLVCLWVAALNMSNLITK